MDSFIPLRKHVWNLTARRCSSIQINSWKKWWKTENLHPLSAEILTEAAMLNCVSAHPIWSWCRSCLATSQSCYKCLFKSVFLVRASGNLDCQGQAVWSHFMRFFFYVLKQVPTHFFSNNNAATLFLLWRSRNVFVHDKTSPNFLLACVGNTCIVLFGWTFPLTIYQRPVWSGVADFSVLLRMHQWQRN